LRQTEEKRHEERFDFRFHWFNCWRLFEKPRFSSDTANRSKSFIFLRSTSCYRKLAVGLQEM